MSKIDFNVSIELDEVLGKLLRLDKFLRIHVITILFKSLPLETKKEVKEEVDDILDSEIEV